MVINIHQKTPIIKKYHLKTMNERMVQKTDE